MKATILFSVAAFLVIVAVDLYWHRDGLPGNTISELARWLGHRWWWTMYVLIAAMGGLIQHFYQFDQRSWFLATAAFMVGMILSRVLGL